MEETITFELSKSELACIITCMELVEELDAQNGCVPDQLMIELRERLERIVGIGL